MAITSRALAFASRWFDEATVRRVFEPLVADWQREWQEASPPRRSSVSIRGLAAFLCAVVVSTPHVWRTPAPQAVTNRVAVRITRFVALASLLLMVIPLLTQMQESGWRGIVLFSLLPSAITAVFPFSMIGAVDAIRRHDPLAPHVERAVVAKLGVIAILFMLVFGGFVVPAANQLADGPPVRGVRELNTYQLVADPTLAAAQEPYTGGADRATRIQRELNNRAMLTLMPVVLLWLRWRGLERTSGRWWSPLPASLTTTLAIVAFLVSYFSGFILELELRSSPGSGFWLPIVVLAIWGSTESYLRRRRASI